MSIARFKVTGRSRSFNTKSEATVTINRSTNLVTVRPSRYRKTYEMRLEDLAIHVIYRCIQAEIREKKAAKKAMGL